MQAVELIEKYLEGTSVEELIESMVGYDQRYAANYPYVPTVQDLPVDPSCFEPEPQQGDAPHYLDA